MKIVFNIQQTQCIITTTVFYLIYRFKNRRKTFSLRNSMVLKYSVNETKKNLLEKNFNKIFTPYYTTNCSFNKIKIIKKI